MALQIRDLRKEYEGVPVYRDFSLDITEGLITCILGQVDSR